MKCLAAVIESKRTATNAMPPRPLSAVPKTSYIWEGKQRQKRLPPLVRIGQLEGAQNWEMWTGTGQQLTVPLERATTTSRPDVALFYSIIFITFIHFSFTYLHLSHLCHESIMPQSSYLDLSHVHNDPVLCISSNMQYAICAFTSWFVVTSDQA